MSMNVTVSSGQTYPVSSGQTDTGDIVLFGGTLDVLSGGTIIDTVDSGTVNVSAGGSASGTTIYGNFVAPGVGSETIGVGGIDHGALISAGGIQYDFGSADGDMIYANGVQFVESGGVASGTTLSSGSEEVLSGGAASGTTISSGVEVVSSGGTAIRTTIKSGGTLILAGGATADLSGTTVCELGGTVELINGYNLSGFEVTSGVNILVANGATASGTIIDSGGFVHVQGGGGAQAQGTKVKSGGELILQFDGTASGTTIYAGGWRSWVSRISLVRQIAISARISAAASRTSGS